MPTREDVASHSIWTVGHSNRAVEAFVELLKAAGIELVADVRRFPGSKRHPQFRREDLQLSLDGEGIGYRHFVDLGGRRSRRIADSPNTAWRVESFNAYADHMQTPEFQAGLDELTSTARQRRTAIMCSEAVPWRCHRRLIADALVARGWRVFDVISPGPPKEHTLTEFARVENGQVTYPGGMLF
jgi:uncharacterized protein (DUF488 family)